MYSETDKEMEINSQIDEEEEAPTTGFSSNVVTTGKPRIHITVKFLMQRNANEEVATRCECLQQR
jgi:hypothetical protein